ncbi:hypothetical protein SERLA73DRAFT_130927, partial [Serpula lacrymans var. lacrymans S7.3]
QKGSMVTMLLIRRRPSGCSKHGNLRTYWRILAIMLCPRTVLSRHHSLKPWAMPTLGYQRQKSMRLSSSYVQGVACSRN